jgi:hypothetical protein
MSQKKLDPSAADLIASANEALRWKQRLIESQIQEVPKGWKTREDIEKILELGKSQTLAWLRKAIANNICEKRDFIIFENGRRAEKPHYFLK